MVKKINHLLRVTYPPLILGVALVAWASTQSPTEVVRALPPPAGDGFLSWTPVLSQQNQCEKNDRADQLIRKGCSFNQNP